MIHQRGLVVVKVICGPRAAAVHELASTASPFLTRLRAVEKKRLALGISRRALAERAGVSERAIAYALAERKSIRPSTLRKIEQALATWRSAERQSFGFVGELYRSLLAAFATEAGIDPERVLQADPRHERGAIARARMRAVYIMQAELGMTMTAVAALVGVTKQAVSKSVREIEDERDDPAIDALISRVARRVAGRG